MAALRRAAIIVALLNLAYFAVEFGMASAIGSTALFADSADFFEDAAVNLLVALALGWPLVWRARIGMAMAVIAMVPALFAVWTAWLKVQGGEAPNALALSLTGLGALLVNIVCAFMLARVRHQGGSLGKAAFLQARNDALANLAIIAAGLITARSLSAWPDVIVGIGIFLLNLDAAKQVWATARQERAELVA